MSGQDDHSAAKRRQIIGGAEIVFTEAGYEGASMSRIARQAGVSKGTLYNYFEGKAELFAAFVSQKASRSLAGIFDPILNDDDIGVVLHHIATSMLTLMLAPGSVTLYRVVISEAAAFPRLAEIYWENGPQCGLDSMADWLRQQMAVGRLRDADPDEAAGRFFALCHMPVCNRRRLQMLAEVSQAERSAIADGAVGMFLSFYRTHGT